MSDNQRTELGLGQDGLARFLIENVTDYAIFMLDAEGRVATWNTGAERVLGYEEGQILGRHFSRFFTPEDTRNGKPENELRNATREGRAITDGWHVRKDGGRIWCDGATHALRERHGYVKVMRDLTEKRLAEDRLREIGEQLRKRTEELEAANRRKDEGKSRTPD